ncbi:OmpA family protein [Lentiprolixibacter aurantiacus]|uniref:OmpA family protein n=1 Tax=Lentiprolixibacter aurantiacus TaxID=2993939 RepID=A0AAE3SMF5_9FLAO|nr:OmpA family protein [Lentiprolixibacter aurantiacus]MCX2718529.1 OmpA family protein [Lentiprolixibacter aurantiacus]
MKIIGKYLLLLLFLTGVIANASVSGSNSPNTEVTDLLAEQAFFVKAAKTLKLSHRKAENLEGVSHGYYLIAGVFGSPENASRFKKKLSFKGLRADIILNPENKMHYVSMGYRTSGLDLLDDYKKKIRPSYTDKVWILQVENEIPNLDKSVDYQNQTDQASGEYSSVSFAQLAKANKIATRSLSASENIAAGYYVIGGVFGERTNAERFQARLKSKFLKAGFLKHPEKDLHQVYLDRFDSGLDAIAACNSNFQGKYQENVWILEVTHPIEDSNEEEILEITKLLTENPQPKVNKQLQNRPLNDKLLEKADAYFDKMWYSEAAELYETVLAKGESNYGFKVIERAADAHYFNTNIERAFYWYDMLYRNYRKEMSANNLFRYAHTLKGSGKYARSKRLMRLYDRKIERGEGEEEKDMNKAVPREVILDNILAASGDVEIKNVAVNSRYSDFSPMFYGDDELVYSSSVDSAFLKTRRYKWNNQPFLDLYVAKINKENQEVKDAVKFSKKINTKYHEASVAFSPDNNTMYFTRNNYGKKLKRDKKGVNHLKIYSSRKVNGEWTEAKELPFNSDYYSTGHPALSPDGKQLYFVSDMPGTIGKTDIFVVDILEDGSFSDPRNLGPEINTEQREMFPFISEKKLYFSSDGHVGLGGLDVFEVAYTEEEGFGDVKNLGQPVNSKVDDFSYIIDETSQKGFFASNRRGGKGDDDIYSFQNLVPEEVNENAIAGVITERVTGEVMPGTLVTLLDENNIKLKELLSDEDGSFVFEDLDGNTKYVVKTVKDAYQDHELAVSTLDNERVEVNIEMDKLEKLITIEEGIRKLKVDMIYFDFDKSYIRKDAAESLDKLVATMKEYPRMIIKIESHTDSRGPAVYNKYLSDKRAKSTRAYLIQQGIDPKRIQSAIGYGEERLLNECDGTVRCTSQQHQRNRRSEFIIVSM